MNMAWMWQRFFSSVWEGDKIWIKWPTEGVQHITLQLFIEFHSYKSLETDYRNWRNICLEGKPLYKQQDLEFALF